MCVMYLSEMQSFLCIFVAFHPEPLGINESAAIRATKDFSSHGWNKGIGCSLFVPF